MPDLIGSIASLTGCRDRDLIDTSLVEMLAEWLDPLAVGLYRSVGEPGDSRLLRQAGQRRGQPVLRGNPPWTPVEALPTAAERPHHHRALAAGEPVLGVPVVPDGEDAACAPALLNVFPVWVGAQRLGVVEVVSERPLGDAQCELLAGVLQVYRNHIGLLDYSEHDTLTGLLNRKTFDAQFAKHQDAAGPGAASSPGQWLGVIDIDHFKRVNDAFGHLIGDEVLLLVARLLRGAFRHGDRLYRFGGEEFVVVLRADEEAHAALAFERFRARMEAFRFPQVGPVTASVGFTRLRPLDSASGAFARADRTVYHAKQHGRNLVCCHETLVASGELSDMEKSGEIELF